MNGLPDYKFINTFFIQVPTATNTTFNQTQCLTSFRQGNAQKKKTAIQKDMDQVDLLHSLKSNQIGKSKKKL